MTTQKLNTDAEVANRAVVTRLYDEAFNQGKLEIADQLISPGFIVPGPNGGGTGPEGFKANARQLLNGFPDIHFTVHDLIAENDRVAVYWTWAGTHQGAFATIPPTGKPVRQEGMVMYRFENGKVAEAKVLFDRLGVFQQLGTFPESLGKPPAVKAA